MAGSCRILLMAVEHGRAQHDHRENCLVFSTSEPAARPDFVWWNSRLFSMASAARAPHVRQNSIDRQQTRETAKPSAF
jgi:hypothetical protein